MIAARAYGARDAMAALRLGMFGLALDQLDDVIEALLARRDPEAVQGARFWQRQRSELLRLLDLDADGRAVEDKARMLAGLLREGQARQLLRDAQRRLPPPGERATVYTAKVPATVKRERIAQAAEWRQQGYTIAVIAKKIGVAQRTVERWLAAERR